MKLLLVFLIIVMAFCAISMAEPPYDHINIDPDKNVDNTTFIDANNILMFVTNHGNFGRDLSGMFGYDYGTFYPFTGITDITSGANTTSPLYSGGLWVGGIVNTQTRVTLSEYSSEYVPGPMYDGTYMPDNPNFRVYTLFNDSLAANPGYDYTHWPTGQGAPIDVLGRPQMLGEQMLWSAFNDADPSAHDNDGGNTAPLGLEIQHRTWAVDSSWVDTTTVVTNVYIEQAGNTELEISVDIVDPAQVTGDEYKVIVGNHPVLGPVWHLINTTLGIPVLENQTNFSGDNNYSVVDGIRVRVTYPYSDGFFGFANFEVVANSWGPLDPPAGGAFGFAGFPSELIETNQQSQSDARWAFHTADNGGTCGGGTRGSYDAFMERVTRGGGLDGMIGTSDYEMRFTGDFYSPGVEGSYAIELYDDANVFWVPFELWNIGIGTPDDPSDDYRMIPYIIDDGNDNTFNLESWGCPDFGGGDLEHSASGSDDDPFTDWVYWNNPGNTTPGESGYLDAEAQMLSGSYDGVNENQVMARTVLIGYNAGSNEPYWPECPEQGTVFRISTVKQMPADTFTFSTDIDTVMTEIDDERSIFMTYKLYNKGTSTIEDCYIAIWADVELGGNTDDVVGCDSLANVMYCYNADNSDTQYGDEPPAIGYKFYAGPIVPSPGSDAYFDGRWMPDYTNLPMSAFSGYYNGVDPNDAGESYNYIRGLTQFGSPYINPSTGMPTTFMYSGDPVTGTGDVDLDPRDKRIIGSFGPFTFAPGDSQFVYLKMAVGQGPDALSSYTVLRAILDAPMPQLPTSDLTMTILPDPQYALYQYAVIPVIDTIFVEDFGFFNELDMGTFLVNGSLTPTSTTILPSHPDFNGQVLAITFPATDFITGYGLLWDVTEQPYTVSGALLDATPFEFTGNVTMVGHLSGDVNADGTVNAGDAIHLVNYIFRDGPAPKLREAAEVNGDGFINVGDAVFLVNYIFRGGPAPSHP